MASISKRGLSWRATVFKVVGGKRLRTTGTFTTKKDAIAWGADVEREKPATELAQGLAYDKTFGDLLKRYRDEVSVKKAGHRWESYRLNRYCSEPIGEVKVEDITTPMLVEWREKRLREVCKGTVAREMNILSNLFQIATKEWHWIKTNPFPDVSRPPPTPHRARRYTRKEIDDLTHTLGYKLDAPPVVKRARVGAALLFAIETGMREGEIANIYWPDVEIDRRFLHVIPRAGSQKTFAAQREVPLSTEAIRILKQLPRTENKAFGFANAAVIDTGFRWARDRLGIENLTFHDSRHEACTRLARNIPVMDLAKMMGHKNLKQLMIYYNPTAEEIASRLP